MKTIQALPDQTLKPKHSNNVDKSELNFESAFLLKAEVLRDSHVYPTWRNLTHKG
jgi:hypothetical protein